MIPERRNLSAIFAQAMAEPKRLIVLTEGESDRDAIRLWAKQNTIALDAYFINDFDVPIDDSLRPYGSNKGRVITAIRDFLPQDITDSNLKGLVDRDIDFIVGRVISNGDLIYTPTTSFPNIVYHESDLIYVYAACFRKELTFRRAEYALLFGRWVLALKAYLWNNKLFGGIPEFARSISNNWSFDFDAFIQKVSARNGRLICRAEIDRLAATVDGQNGDFHSALAFLHTASRKSGLVGSVTLEEYYRHFFHRQLIVFDTAELSSVLSGTAADL